MLENALTLANAGYRVFPLEPGGKRPLIETGVKAATRDTPLIDWWWTRWPDAGIGIATGEGLVVIDVDEPGAEEPLALPDTFRVSTSKGYHLYYRGDGRNTASKLAPGVDTRGDGGYVKAWDLVEIPETWELAELPQNICAKIAKPLVETPKPESEGEYDADHLKRLIDGWETAVSGRNGNDVTYRLGCALRNAGSPLEQALRLVAESAWNTSLHEAWSYEELKEGPIGSAYKYAQEGATKTPSAVFGEPPAPPPNPFKPLVINDLLKLPPVEWVIQDTIPAGEVAMIYGPAGHGKSFIVLDMLARASLGLPWGGLDTKPGMMVYATGEGLRGLGARASALQDHIGQPLDKLRFVTAMPRAGDKQSIQDFIDALRPDSPSVVVLDTLWRFMLGLDDSSNRDAGVAMAAIDHIRHELGCSVVVIHHATKDGRGYRGASALEAAVEAKLSVTQEDGVIETRVEKQKDGELWKAKHWRLEAKGDSAIIMPTRPLASPEESQYMARVTAAKMILADAGVPVALNALAQAVAEATSDAPELVLAGVKRSLTEWAHKVPECVLHHGGKGRGNETVFRA